jgi:DNA polymerase III delta' subunit
LFGVGVLNVVIKIFLSALSLAQIFNNIGMIFLEERIKNFLERFFEAENKPVQSLLFYGPEGLGKKTTALAFAKALLCEETNKQWEGCQKCQNCLRFDKGLQPDFLLIEPEDNKLEIETIRKAIEFLYYEPQFSSLRILIIDQADRLREDSQNTLLKTLEEPPPNTLIILITSLPQKLLITVRSRLLGLRFSCSSSAKIQDFLIKNYSLNVAQAKEISQQSEGRIGLALKLLNKRYQTEIKKHQVILKTLLHSNFVEQSQIIQELTKDKNSLHLALQNWLESLHLEFKAETQEKTSNLAFPPASKVKLTKELLKAFYLIFDYNINANLLLENIFLPYAIR